MKCETIPFKTDNKDVRGEGLATNKAIIKKQSLDGISETAANNSALIDVGKWPGFHVCRDSREL